MNNRSIFILEYLILAVLVLSCNKPIVIPDDFVETTPPKYGTNAWRELNYSNHEFKVQKIKGELKISEAEEKDICELEIANGKLIGTDRGEWGGYLKYIPNDSTLKTIEARTGNIKFLFESNKKIYLIDGLAHLSYSGGSLFELSISDTNFVFKQIIDFGDAPEAFAIYRDKLLIATHQNFYVVNDLKKELFFKDTFWSSLYPNSIVVFNEENVFMGIRGGIVKLDLIKKQMKFYKYDK